MLRAGFFTLLVGPAAAAMTDECMEGLHQLEGGNDVELSLRCRAAFGPDACRQARQSLGAQPWTHARMERSCKRFAAVYEGMDARTLEAAVATKTSTETATDATVNAKVATQPVAAAQPPVQQPAEQEGPVAGLLAKLKEKKDAEAKAEAAKEKEEKQAGPLAGLKAKMKEAKAAHEAQAKQDATAAGDNQAQGPLAGLMNKVKEAKAAHEAQAKQDAPAAGSNQASGPLAGLMSKMKKAKAEHEKNAAEVESDQQGPLAELLKHGKQPPTLKLYTDVQLEQPAAGTGMHQVLGAFAGAASLAAMTLFVASRRAAAPMDHEQLSEQLDTEQNVE